MSTDGLIWMEGKIIPAKDAKISIFSPTCQYGLNVFEGIRCYLSYTGDHLIAFRLKDHIERLFLSAKVMRLIPKYSPIEVQNAFFEIILSNKYLEDIAVRIVFYISESGNWAKIYECDMLIAPIPMGRAYDSKVGIHCCTSTWERINDRSVSPRIKAGANYINSRMAQLEALVNG